MITRRDFTRLSLFGVGLGLANCSAQPDLSVADSTQSSESSDLIVWWEQGHLSAENEQITQIVRQWEQKFGLTVNLKIMPVDLIAEKFSQLIEESATATSQLPDILYSVGVDPSLAPKLAWRDELLDLSEVIESAQDRYTPVALSQVFYRNQVRGERNYYAVPLWQAEDYIHYWKPFIEELGYSPADVPMEWNAFWQFWQNAQTQLRTKGHPDLYGIGLSMSDSGFDTYTSLIMFLDAYNVEVVSDEGELLLVESQNRQRMAAALNEYTRFFLEGYVPPTAVKWSGSGNNSNFIAGNVIMTQNLTLSIPLTQKLPPSVYNQDAAKRYRQMATIGRPQKPDGAELLTRKGIKQAIVPKNCPHPEAAQEFLKYLIEPQNLKQLIIGFKGRVLPVMPQLFENSIWSDSSDPHLSAAFKVFQRPSLLPYEVIHSAFSEVQNQQLWGKTLLKIIEDNASPTEAADWVIKEIQDIWIQWEQPK
ncbi:MAG: ABC transporter substrate-binding protein [Cyanobacteria bacterium P01_F01_bin.150]